MNIMIKRNNCHYGPDTFFLSGSALPVASSPTAVQYSRLVLALICKKSTGEIVDAECNMVVNDVMSAYIVSELIGYSIYTDVEAMSKLILDRCGGASPKALIAALHNAYSKSLDRNFTRCESD